MTRLTRFPSTRCFFTGSFSGLFENVFASLRLEGAESLEVILLSVAGGVKGEEGEDIMPGDEEEVRRDVLGAVIAT